MTRVAVVSDTHLPRRGRTLPRRLLQECERADRILHAGDFVRHAVLAELQAYGRVDGVLGNCDDLDLVGVVPETQVVEIDGVRIGMVHDAGAAAGRAARMAARFPDCQVVVFGHSHQPLIERDGDLMLLNPGSAIDRRREPVCTMAVLELDGERLVASLVELPPD